MSMQPVAAAFDHLVIGAEDLDGGERWALAHLKRGVPLGGAHPQMGTHNRLARFPTLPGRASSGYLEIIAIDPAAAPPGRPRWYGLDDAATQARLAARPRPVAWVLAVDDLDEAASAAAAAGWNVGDLLSVTRDDLDWRIAVPRDGLPVMGVLPALIEWPERLNRRAPTDRMQDLGLPLREIRLFAADVEAARGALESLGAAAAVAGAGAALTLRGAPPDAVRIEAVLGGADMTMTA